MAKRKELDPVAAPVVAAPVVAAVVDGTADTVIDEGNKAVVEQAPPEPVKPKWADALVYLRCDKYSAAGWVLGDSLAQCGLLFCTLVRNLNNLDTDAVVVAEAAEAEGPVPGDLVLCSLVGEGKEPIAQVPFQSVTRKPAN